MTEGQPTTCRKLKTYTQIAQALSSYTQKMVWLLVHLQEDSKDVGLCLSAQRLKEVGQLVRNRESTGSGCGDVGHYDHLRDE